MSSTTIRLKSTSIRQRTISADSWSILNSSVNVQNTSFKNAVNSLRSRKNSVGRKRRWVGKVYLIPISRNRSSHFAHLKSNQWPKTIRFQNNLIDWVNYSIYGLRWKLLAKMI